MTIIVNSNSWNKHRSPRVKWTFEYDIKIKFYENSQKCIKHWVNFFILRLIKLFILFGAQFDLDIWKEQPFHTTESIAENF